MKYGNAVKTSKESRTRHKTTLKVYQAIIGDSIEIQMERLREGEGEDGIQDRDLVYNDAEASSVNPVTNIRSDKIELMLEQKIGEYEHKERKHNHKINKDIDKVVEEENKELNEKPGESKE